jgi:hypothetical protein
MQAIVTSDSYTLEGNRVIGILNRFVYQELTKNFIQDVGGIYIQ